MSGIRVISGLRGHCRDLEGLGSVLMTFAGSSSRGGVKFGVNRPERRLDDSRTGFPCVFLLGHV